MPRPQPGGFIPLTINNRRTIIVIMIDFQEFSPFIALVMLLMIVSLKLNVVHKKEDTCGSIKIPFHNKNLGGLDIVLP